MNFDYSPRVQELQKRLLAFMDEHIYPNEQRFFDEIAANRAKGLSSSMSSVGTQALPLARLAAISSKKRCSLG